MSDNNYTFHDNKQEVFEVINPDRAEWNEESNSYIIYMNDQVDCIITNNDILNNILNNDNNNNNIKKYIFILSYNPISGVSEFNFINSVFTSNLDLIIKLQNFIYDTLNNENMNNDILLFFYYQLIIWLFKNISLFEKDKVNDKLSKVYSSISYRFSSLILKNIIKIKELYSSNSESIEQLLKIKNDLVQKLDNMNNINNNLSSTSHNTNSDNTNSDNTNSDNTNSDNTNSDNTNSDNTNSDNTNSDNTNSDNTNSDTSSKKYVEDNILNKYNIVNKNGLQITNFNDLFTEDNSDNSVNGYTEINDTIDDTLTKKGDNTNISKIKDIEHSSNNTNTKSYNMESILNNSKIYNIKI
jgi:hypothetical protein